MLKGEEDVFEEEEVDEVGGSKETPPAVDEEESPEVLELFEVVVGGVSCLLAFVAHDADADLGLLDHGDVVAAIADCQGDDLEVLLDELDDLGLLVGSGPAAYDSPTLGDEVEEDGGDFLGVEDGVDGFSFDDERVGVVEGVGLVGGGGSLVGVLVVGQVVGLQRLAFHREIARDPVLDRLHLGVAVLLILQKS